MIAFVVRHEIIRRAHYQEDASPDLLVSCSKID